MSEQYNSNILANDSGVHKFLNYRTVKQMAVNGVISVMDGVSIEEAFNNKQ